MKNVLIITRSFPPKNNIAARRFGYMVRYMEEFGWKPWVVTVPSTGDLPVTISEDQIARIAVPNRSYRADNNAHSVWRGLRFRFDVLASSWYWSVTSNRQLVDRFPRPDIVLASYGPNSALWLGRYFSKNYQVPWIADFRDPGALRLSARSRLAEACDLAGERMVLRNAAGVTTAGRFWSRTMETRYGKPTQTVLNGFEYLQESLNKTTETESSSCAYIHYAGTLYPHQVDAFKLVLNAMRKISGVSLKTRLLGYDDPKSEVEQHLHKLGLWDRVSMLPPCDASTALHESAHATVNLVVEDLGGHEDWRRGTLTGKLLPLLALEPPVLAVARPDSDIGPVLRTTNKGHLCCDIPSIVDFVSSVKNGNSFPGNRPQIAYFSKRSQCRTLCAFLDQFAG